MIKKIISSLEDDNNPLLGPSLWGLKYCGLWQTSKGLSSIFYNLFLFGTVLFIVSQYVELWCIRADLALAIKNLSVTMLSTVCIFKAVTYVAWQKYWRDIANFVSTLEVTQLSSKDRITKNIIGKYTRYSRKVTYLYWILVAGTVFTLIAAPLAILLSSEFREKAQNGSVPYPEMMSSWAPFDRTRGFGYWVVFIEQGMICVYGGCVVATYDTNAVALMNFFAGQMELLNINCSRLFEDIEEINYLKVLKRIKDCHNHHLSLIKYCKILNSVLSPVMFLYVIICSLMICANAIQLTTDGTTSMERIWIAEYLIALIAQLFLFCWHSNEVLVMSSKVDNGVYKGDWWTQNVRIQRCVLLLGGQLRKTVYFTAGPFTQLNLHTFIAILKGSYSYYTLLSKKEDYLNQENGGLL